VTGVRERLERALLLRLRDASDGQPRADQLGMLLREIAASERIVLSAAELRALERYFDDRFFGLGAIAPLLRDERVSEVMVNGTRGVWIERDGHVEATPIRFRDADEILVLIERLVAPLGRRIDSGRAAGLLAAHSHRPVPARLTPSRACRARPAARGHAPGSAGGPRVLHTAAG
jgi:pilus assembly protein CpaF